MSSRKTLYHVTVLSNFARAFDKYSRRYSKSCIPQSSFPGQFYLLEKHELQVGVDKAGRLLDKLGLAGDRLLVLQTSVAAGELRENLRTGLGQYVESD